LREQNQEEASHGASLPKNYLFSPVIKTLLITGATTIN
jgi:hypothetical protein